MMELRVKWLDEADRGLGLPSYATKGAAGADLRANLPDRGQVTLAPGARALIPTGLSLEIPAGYEVQLRPRSGLAHKYGVTLTNSPGTIDSDYRGPLGVLMINHGSDEFTITHGERIAQMVVAPVIQPQIIVVDELDDTDRGSGGFGSTGRS